MIDKIIYIGRDKNCYACKELKPRLMEIMHNHDFYNFHNVEADSEEGEQLCELYGVQSVPTVLFFDHNGLKGKTIGNVPDSELEEHFR